MLPGWHDEVPQCKKVTRNDASGACCWGLTLPGPTRGKVFSGGQNPRSDTMFTQILVNETRPDLGLSFGLCFAGSDIDMITI